MIPADDPRRTSAMIGAARAGITGPGACATDDVRVPRALDATWTPAGYP
ncbi:MAG: hypothetical protein AAGK21_08830 [Bacteroidota bacterium]